MAWQTVNEANRRKSTTRAKLKAAIQEERLHKLKEHFQNLLGNPPETTDKSTQNIICSKLDIKPQQLMEKELNAVLKKYPLKFGKQQNLITYFSDYEQNTQEKWTKGCIFPFPKKGNHKIPKNFRGITLTDIAAKVYNTLYSSTPTERTQTPILAKKNLYWY